MDEDTFRFLIVLKHFNCGQHAAIGRLRTGNIL
jgi:hypothetical protein